MEKLTSLGKILTKQQKNRIVVAEYAMHTKSTVELKDQQSTEKVHVLEEPAFAMVEA